METGAFPNFTLWNPFSVNANTVLVQTDSMCRYSVHSQWCPFINTECVSWFSTSVIYPIAPNSIHLIIDLFIFSLLSWPSSISQSITPTIIHLSASFSSNFASCHQVTEISLYWTTVRLTLTPLSLPPTHTNTQIWTIKHHRFFQSLSAVPMFPCRHVIHINLNTYTLILMNYVCGENWTQTMCWLIMHTQVHCDS